MKELYKYITEGIMDDDNIFLDNMDINMFINTLFENPYHNKNHKLLVSGNRIIGDELGIYYTDIKYFEDRGLDLFDELRKITKTHRFNLNRLLINPIDKTELKDINFGKVKTINFDKGCQKLKNITIESEFINTGKLGLNSISEITNIHNGPITIFIAYSSLGKKLSKMTHDQCIKYFTEKVLPKLKMKNLEKVIIDYSFGRPWICIKKDNSKLGWSIVYE